MKWNEEGPLEPDQERDDPKGWRPRIRTGRGGEILYSAQRNDGRVTIPVHSLDAALIMADELPINPRFNW